MNLKTDNTYASAAENYGAVFFYSNGTVSKDIANFTGAYLSQTTA